MQLRDVIAELKSMGDPKAAAGMARYGIKADGTLGVSIPKLQSLARKIGKRNNCLNKKAIAVAKQIQQFESGAAQWVARDGLRELRSENVQKRLSGRATA